MPYSTDEQKEIAMHAKSIITKQNWDAGLPMKFTSYYVDVDSSGMPMLVLRKQTASYDYKFYVRYNFGTDSFDTRFGKMNCASNGKAMFRDDWCVMLVTEWTNDLPLENLFLSLHMDFNNRGKLEYHNLADEIK